MRRKTIISAFAVGLLVGVNVIATSGAVAESDKTSQSVLYADKYGERLPSPDKGVGLWWAE